MKYIRIGIMCLQAAIIIFATHVGVAVIKVGAIVLVIVLGAVSISMGMGRKIREEGVREEG